MRSIVFLFLTVSIFIGKSYAKDVADIYSDFQKFYTLKRVLYIAAHPDDENTRALAWFSLGENAETAYLSLTRGDGGQNLIGNELGKDLGVLRTQELLQARSYDGAKQFFTRAVDFGYSRSADESFEKWGKEEILSDVVLVIRQFKPDVIITRFPPTKQAGHGHHTASAMLAIEGFSKAADPTYLPHQVEKYGAWKATSLYWNASNWWNKEIDSIAQNNPDYLIKDIGGYNAYLGMSYNEIGTIARSQHKCQGFGAILERGSRLEYFKYLEGDKLKEDFFEGNIRSWEKLVSTSFHEKLKALMANFNFVQPHQNVDALLNIRKELVKLEPSPFKEEKMALCEQMIMDCMGLHVEVLGDDYAFVDGEKTALIYEVINRSPIEATLESVETEKGKTKEVNEKLTQNALVQENIEQILHAQLSKPYWLEKPFADIYQVSNPENLGKAKSPSTFSRKVTIRIKEERFVIDVPVKHKWRDPSYGERQREVICTPSFSVNFDRDIAIIKPNQKKSIKLKVHAFQGSIQDVMHIAVPKGWEAHPNTIPIHLTNKHEEAWVEFELTAKEEGVNGIIQLTNNAGNALHNLTEISYDHIPTQTVFSVSELSCIKLDAEIKTGKIAYIKGVEDAVPQAIEQLGFEVKVFEVSDVPNITLSNFQSVVLGIRIYNVHPELKNYDQKLFEYVKNGGNVIMQYNTKSRREEPEQFGPVPFELSRNRVTEEDAEVTFLMPEHPLLNTPNKMTQSDFENWVQERGLYFADNWDQAYVPLLSWHDKDEAPANGALIVTKYGKGQFVYTGVSFFRELPKGVVGAYKLFANLLSYTP